MKSLRELSYYRLKKQKQSLVIGETTTVVKDDPELIDERTTVVKEDPEVCDAKSGTPDKLSQNCDGVRIKT